MHGDQENVTGTRFKVADMSCDHCVATIRKALERGMPGAAVSIDLAAHEVAVAGDAVLAERIIRDAGYDPRLMG